MTAPGKGREKIPPRSSRGRPPAPDGVMSEKDFDRALRGLLSVPNTVKPKPRKRKGR